MKDTGEEKGMGINIKDTNGRQIGMEGANVERIGMEETGSEKGGSGMDTGEKGGMGGGENDTGGEKPNIERGNILAGERRWTPHGSFRGVFTDTVIAGESTEGSATCLLVRIDPGMAIGRHVHEKNTEIHYVVEGRGVCTVQGRRIDYSPGTVAVMPRGEEHDVATEGGLRLLAVFTPRL